jgi:putative (di)nucleoside polyphosphate hydrolase
MSSKRPQVSGTPKLPLRVGVGIMLVDGAGRVWLGKRRPRWVASSMPDTWQMPQGGLLPGEHHVDAAVRELEEETGVTSAEIIVSSADWYTWELPADLLGVALKGRYRGQRQRWVLARFTGADSEIDICGRLGQKAEFTDWAWVERRSVVGLTVAYKHQLYSDILGEFEPLVETGACGVPAE